MGWVATSANTTIKHHHKADQIRPIGAGSFPSGKPGRFVCQMRRMRLLISDFSADPYQINQPIVLAQSRNHAGSRAYPLIQRLAPEGRNEPISWIVSDTNRKRVAISCCGKLSRRRG